jgi:hypothetical protein
MSKRESEQKFASQIMGFTVFVITTALLFVPSRVTPKVDWLSAIHFDKIVHFILFGVLTLSWCIYYYKGNFRSATKRIMYGHMFLIFSLYAVAVEFAQGHFTQLGRSFDLYDIAAGVTGCLVSYMYAREQFVRKD